jgi:hypothetical protein
MPRIQWPLHLHRPQVEVRLRLAGTGQEISRRLVADTGAGTRFDAFELILDEEDCLLGGGIFVYEVGLSGAFSGKFPVYLLDVSLPGLLFGDALPVVGAPRVPRGFDGIACFRFLSRFTYGNFGNPDTFVLEAG